MILPGMAAGRAIGAALEKALRGVQTRPEDAAAVELARRYAADLDEAAVVAATLAKTLRELLSVSPDLHDRLLTLAVRIEDTAVLASLGPKLLAALEQLGMTPRARAAVAGRGGDPRDGSPRRAALNKLREQHPRVNGAAAVDPAAP